jgi:hypothetical protein
MPATTQTLDNFSAAAFVPDAAVFANQSITINSDTIEREDSSGTVWVQPSKDEGFYPRVPPAGVDGRKVRAVVKMCRNDPDTAADEAIDDISARLFVTPRYLSIPG